LYTEILWAGICREIPKMISNIVFSSYIIPDKGIIIKIRIIQVIIV